MENKTLYTYKKFTIEKIDREDRVDYFTVLEKERILDREHTIKYLNRREFVKQETVHLYKDLGDTTWVIRHDGNYIGYFTIDPPTMIASPTAKDIFILKRFRKSKAIICVIDYILNHLYPAKNIQVSSQFHPGFDKIINDIMPDQISIGVFDRTIIERVKNILRT